MFGKQFSIAVRAVGAFMFLTGVLYPATITVVAQTMFPAHANGSLIVRNGKIVGSNLIGQPFSDPKYFWSRPSATGPAYNAASSSGSNLGPANPALLDAVKGRVEVLRKADPTNSALIPVDLVTASASGLDPHISLAAAAYQAGRVARARGLSESVIRDLVARHAQPRRVLGLLGEPVVNVLLLNLDLDGLSARYP